MEENINKFNKPPVYGQRVIDEIEQLRKMANHAPDNEYKAGFLKAITNVKAIIDEYLPPSPGSVDVEEKKECQHEALTDTGVGYHHCPTCNASFKVDGLGDSSGSEKEKSQFREPSTQGGEETDWHLAFRSISQSHIKQANRIRVLEEALKRVLNINGIARGHISEEFFQSIEQALNPKD